MQKSKRPLVAVVKEQSDYEKDLSKKRLTDQEIRDRVPQVWKDRAEVARQNKILLPLRGSDHYA